MVQYLILDGYNLIWALDRYGETDGGIGDARELLVNDALKASGWTGREIILVFDAHKSPESESRDTYGGGAVRVIYSGPGRTADDVIERLMEKLKDATVTVYTADFALQRTALASGVTRATPREFQSLLDELPASVNHPEAPRRSTILDTLSPETRYALERLRRRSEDH
jgi:predicted RNA-binding protein with PIN domain